MKAAHVVPVQSEQPVESYRCALCGNAFSEARSACGGCMVAIAMCFGKSPVIACPRCGHQFPRSSVVVDFFSRCFSRVRRWFHAS